MDSFASPVTITDVPVPTAPPGGVVVEVKATGMCRSDWHAWAGHDEIDLPHIPGHELAGIITEVGVGVTRWSAGDRVTVPFVCGCGRCEWCRQGDAQVCPHQEQPGFTHHGSFAQYVALHAADANLVAIPEDVPFEAAAALGCRFATAFRALRARAKLQAGEWVLIIGAGGVGLSATMIARALGARPVVVDRHPRALAGARQLGAEHVILSGGSDGVRDVPEAVHTLTGGAHVSVDAVGHPTTASDAVLSLRRRGRHVQIGLLPSDDGRSPVPMARAIAWELDIMGSHGMSASDYPEMLALIAEGRLEPQRLIERTISLDEAARILPIFDSADLAGVTMIDPSA